MINAFSDGNISKSTTRTTKGSAKVDNNGLLHDVNIKEKHRGKGNGDKLMRKVTRKADKHGIKLWSPVEDSKIIDGFYSKHGFKQNKNHPWNKGVKNASPVMEREVSKSAFGVDHVISKNQLWHGTSDENWKRIKRHGLKASPRGSGGPGVYTSFYRGAESYALAPDTDHYLKQFYGANSEEYKRLSNRKKLGKGKVLALEWEPRAFRKGADGSLIHDSAEGPKIVHVQNANRTSSRRMQDRHFPGSLALGPPEKTPNNVFTTTWEPYHHPSHEKPPSVRFAHEKDFPSPLKIKGVPESIRNSQERRRAVNDKNRKLHPRRNGQPGRVKAKAPLPISGTHNEIAVRPSNPISDGFSAARDSHREKIRQSARREVPFKPRDLRTPPSPEDWKKLGARKVPKGKLALAGVGVAAVGSALAARQYRRDNVGRFAPGKVSKSAFGVEHISKRSEREQPAYLYSKDGKYRRQVIAASDIKKTRKNATVALGTAGAISGGLAGSLAGGSPKRRLIGAGIGATAGGAGLGTVGYKTAERSIKSGNKRAERNVRAYNNIMDKPLP